jgi:hypothetical protein
MAIDIESETMCQLTPDGVARYFPKRPSICSLTRWRLKGLRVVGLANPVKLECVKCGGKWHTSAEKIREFIAAQNPQATPANVASPVAQQTPAARARRNAAVRQGLEKLGFK